MSVSNWETISALATAAGTLALAVVTVWSLRSANRAARIAEAALIDQRRPVLVTSRLDDPKQKIMFVDRHWIPVDGGRAVAEHVDGVIYLVISLRNIGAGIAVMRAWAARPGILTSAVDHVPIEELRLQTRDLYVPAGDIGLWQGALRDPDEDTHAPIAEAIAAREPISVDLLYSDHLGDQRTIARVNLVPADGGWLANTGRHWDLGKENARRNHQNGSRLQRSRRSVDDVISAAPAGLRGDPGAGRDQPGGRGATGSARRTPGPTARRATPPPRRRSRAASASMCALEASAPAVSICVRSLVQPRPKYAHSDPLSPIPCCYPLQFLLLSNPFL
jgi:hypothetical protein